MLVADWLHYTVDMPGSERKSLLSSFIIVMIIMFGREK